MTCRQERLPHLQPKREIFSAKPAAIMNPMRDCLVGDLRITNSAGTAPRQTTTDSRGAWSLGRLGCPVSNSSTVHCIAGRSST